MENKVESLNLAVSGGIILFEAKRNRLVFNRKWKTENGK
jgi:tRNA G18 (ribose-2'-O)-methylase SpoU